jgi:translation initiation factor 1A
MPAKSKKNIKFKPETKVRDLEFKEDLQEYAKVLTLLGDRRMTLMLPDQSNILGHVRDALKRKRVRVGVDDVVLVSRREFQSDKVDIIHKYTPDEIKNLIQYGEVPEWFGKTSAMIADMSDVVQDDLGFEFGDGDGEDAIDFDDI